MFDEVRSPGSIQGNKNQRDNDHRQNYVGDEYREIERPHNSLPQKPRVAVIVVISQIRDQEERRTDDSSKLAFQVSPDATLTNHDETDHQKDGTCGIKNRVDVRKVGDVISHSYSESTILMKEKRSTNHTK